MTDVVRSTPPSPGSSAVAAPFPESAGARWTSAFGRLGRAVDTRLLVLGLTLASALYLSWHLGRGWVPHDDGALGQSAERLLLGELPHRDFDEIYTGGLAYLNAAAFRLFGVSMFTMRLVLLAAFAAWVPVVYYVASRIVRRAAAVGVTVLCVVWAVPNYPGPLPSWYNMFLAVAGIAALYRWLEDPRARWLVAAGIAGGLSLLVKVVGLYYVAGVLLFLTYVAHERSRATRTPPTRGVAYALVVSACLLAFCVALTLLVGNQPYAAELVHFVVPSVLASWLLIRNEWTQPAGPSIARFRTLAGLLAPFLVGLVIPVAIFLVPFVRADALGALFRGVFLLPTRRLTMAAYPMLSLWSMLALVPVWALLAYGGRIAERVTRYHVLGLAAALTALLVATSWVPLLYRLVWYASRTALPVLVLLAVVRLARTPSNERTAADRSRLMLLTSVAAVFTLIQFPFSAPIYFCYVGPLVALLAVALLAPSARRAPLVPAALMVFLAVFAVTRTNTSRLPGKGVLYLPFPPTIPLGLPRGGLDVTELDATMYRATMSLLWQHARGDYTYAAPDCPEVYFLSGLRNPTRTFFDDFDDPTGRDARILAATAQHGVTAIVVNLAPSFADDLSDDLMTELRRRYPFAADVGKFQVRWQ